MPAHLPETPLVFVCGRKLSAQIEVAPREELVDHVWITLDCGLPTPVLVSVNTRSAKSREAGLDPRVRVGTVRGEETSLPANGHGSMEHFDYADVESKNNVFYEFWERREMEDLLMDLCSQADMLRAWGMPYQNRGRNGIHQIHSRRKSGAVPEDHRGLDGGLTFFTRRGPIVDWVMLLIKFSGQP